MKPVELVPVERKTVERNNPIELERSQALGQ
jgi:hypothetical protein